MDIRTRQLGARFTICALLLLIPFSKAFSDPAILSPNTEIVNQPNGPPVLTGTSSADVGLVDALTQADATHTYTLTNPTKNTLTLSAIRGSCGCEHMAYLVGGQEVQSTTVAAGASVQVKVNVRLRNQPATELTKTAWIISNTGKVLNTLTISFNVRQPYKVLPQHLDIGDVAAGTVKTALATVQLDTVMLPKGQFPAFQSDTPGVTAQQTGAVVTSSRDNKPCLSATYLISVNRVANLGTFAAMLSFQVTTPLNTVETVYLPITGCIVGDIASSPKAISFGYVTQGTDMERDLVLSGSTADKLKTVTVMSSSSFVTAKVVPNTAANADTCTISIDLSGKPPVGALQATVTLLAGPVQKIIVPINATVVTP